MMTKDSKQANKKNYTKRKNKSQSDCMMVCVVTAWRSQFSLIRYKKQGRSTEGLQSTHGSLWDGLLPRSHLQMGVIYTIFNLHCVMQNFKMSASEYLRCAPKYTMSRLNNQHFSGEGAQTPPPAVNVRRLASRASPHLKILATPLESAAVQFCHERLSY